jgi:D-threonine aldolase
MNHPNFNYKIKNIDQLDSPTLVVYPDQVKQNITSAINMIGDVERLRPHVKTHKSPDVVKLVMMAGITKFKCATIAEAEMLGMCEAPDVVLAYQPTGPKLLRFINVVKKYSKTQYACLTDNITIAQAQADAFHAAQLEIPVFIDLNVGFNRTGISPESAFDLYEACSKMQGIKVVGFQAYDGHLRNPDIKIRTKDCNAAFKKVLVLKEKILSKGLFSEKQGYSEPIIIAGGSPSFPIHAKRKDVECSPGTFIYWDKGYSSLFPEQPFSPAALLITRVVSRPDATKLCLDLGHKSVASENEITKRVTFLDAPKLIPIGQSEEHLVVEAGENHGYRVGDVLYGVPYHICPTVALYERVITIENGEMTGEWRTIARDRTITL